MLVSLLIFAVAQKFFVVASVAGMPVLYLPAQLYRAWMAGYLAAEDMFGQAKALYMVDTADIVNKAVVDLAADSRLAAVAHCKNRIALDFLVSLALAPTLDCTP